MVGLGACREPRAFVAPVLEVSDNVEVLDVPTSEAEFLAELAPLPFAALQVSYDVSGPGGIEGTLEVLTTAGGFRREQWSLTLLVGEDRREHIQGATIQTPSLVWNDGVEGAAVVHEVPLRSLAQAYLKASLPTQRAVTRHLRQWHQSLANAREQYPGQRESVLGVSCLRTTVAGHAVCLWEDTGLPLAYQSEAFEIRAREIELEPEVAANAFEIPDGGRRAADRAQRLDPDASLERLAEGDFVEVAHLLQPGLRLASR